MSKLIACDIHDYFEIACMRKEKVQIKSKDFDNVLEGVAIDIVVKERQEFLVVESQNERLSLNLNGIQTLTFCSSGESIQISQ